MTCPACSKTFASKYNMNRHYENVHDGGREEKETDEVLDNESDTTENEEVSDSQADMIEEEEVSDNDEPDMTEEDELSDEESDSTEPGYSPWTFIIKSTMEEMGLNGKKEVLGQYKEFVLNIMENIKFYVRIVHLLKRDDVYKKLKKEESRWLKRGFSDDEAMSVSWRLRKILVKNLIEETLHK